MIGLREQKPTFALVKPWDAKRGEISIDSRVSPDVPTPMPSADTLLHIMHTVLSILLASKYAYVCVLSTSRRVLLQ